MGGNVIHFGASVRPKPERFKEARRALGLNQSELAKALGVTRQAISAYELGERQPEPAIFVEMVKILKQPLGFFTSERPSTRGPIGPAFYRSMKSAAKPMIDRCEVWREWFAESALLFEKYVKFPEVTFPYCAPNNGAFYSVEEIEEAATTCRRLWGLGDGPISNALSLLESKGVIAARAKFDTEKIDAFSFWCGNRPMIVLSSDKSCSVRSRFDAVHELAHLILHKGIGEEDLENKDILERIESEANHFARAFLLPSQTYAEEVFTLRLDGFVTLKERWKVSVAAQIYRCLDLNLITDDQALNMRKQISKKRWNQKEPLDDTIPVEEPVLLRKCLELVTSSRVASALEISSSAKLDTNLLANFFNVNEGVFAPPPDSGPVLKLSKA